jgi:hypothetical protein
MYRVVWPICGEHYLMQSAGGMCCDGWFWLPDALRGQFLLLARQECQGAQSAPLTLVGIT